MPLTSNERTRVDGQKLVLRQLVQNWLASGGHPAEILAALGEVTAETGIALFGRDLTEGLFKELAVNVSPQG